MQLTRWIVLAAVGAVALAACSGSSESSPSETSDLEQLVAPTGDPATLTPVDDAPGEAVTVADGLAVTVPEGATADDGASQPAGGGQLVFRMPGADADGLPVLQVTWADTGTGAEADSLAHQSRMRASDAVSDYERSSVSWPGADDAVVATWTEEVATDQGSLVTDCLALWVDAPGGTKALAVAVAPQGELEGSTALTALRTLTIG